MPNNDSFSFINSVEHAPNPYIFLNQLGLKRLDAGQNFSFKSNVYAIYFINSGKGALQIEDKFFEAKSNDVFLIRPNQSANFVSDYDSPSELYFFSFMGLFAASLINRTVFKNGGSFATLPNDRLFYYIYRAAMEIDKSDCPDIYGLEQLFKFLSVIVAPTDISYKKSATYIQYVKEAQNYIEQNYSKPILIAELAKSFNLSRSHFYRIFKEHTGISVEKYLADTRLEHAKQLLSETETPISAISEQVGYRNYSAFHAMFKKALTVSPAQYREANKNKK